MALFGSGKDKQKNQANPIVMAYLEDAQMIKSPAMLLDSHKNEIPCNIVAIQEDSNQLHLQLHANLFADKGTKVGFIVIIDNMRILGSSKIQEVRPGSAIIDIPDSFELHERRKKQRAKVNPREGTTATLLSGLFDGIGITGLIENMSETGLRVKVEKAIEIKTEKKITVSSRTLKVGQIFPIVKISKIPQCIATIECGGKVVYIEVTNGVSYIGLSFEELKSEYVRIIEKFVSNRNSPPPTSLPPRVRKQKETIRVDPVSQPSKGGSESEEETEAGAKSKTASSKSAHEPAKEDSAKTPPSNAAAAEKKPETDHETPQPQQQAQPQSQPNAAPSQSHSKRPEPTPLQKLKRRTRTILLFGTEDDTLDQLEKTFQEEGYAKVVRPQSLDEIFESAPQGGAGILLLNLNMPVENCIDIAISILAHISDPIPIVLIPESGQITVGAHLDAQKAGISLLLPGPLKVDDALFSKMEELMGIG